MKLPTRTYQNQCLSESQGAMRFVKHLAHLIPSHRRQRQRLHNVWTGLWLTLFLVASSTLADAQHTEHFRPDADPDDIQLRTLLVQTDPNKAPVERTVQIIDGHVIIEGDIVLGLEKDLFGPGRGAVITDFGNNRWPNGTIPYEIEAGYPDVNMIHYAINHLINNTNICLVPRTNEVNYVKFVLAQGCSSNVGMVGGEQTIDLAQNCGIGATIHEIMHAAGFWHEQSRADRNTYVTINLANITPANAFNFNQYMNGIDVGVYDYSSIMHYGPYAFSSNGMTTIDIKMPPGNASTNIGQRTGVSAGDIAAINSIYPTDAGCGTINVPANLTVRSLGTVTINGSVVTIANCVIENDGSAAIAASSANFFYGLQGNATVTFFGAAQAIPALNPGQTQTIGITNDFAALGNGTYYFGVWVNNNQNPVEGTYSDNTRSWNAPLLTLPVGVPQGYTCATAFDINAAGTFMAPGPTQGNGATDNTVATHAVWYKFTPPMTGMIRVFTCGLAGGGNQHNHVFNTACPISVNDVVYTADRGCQANPNDPAAGLLLENIAVTSGTPIWIEWDDALSNNAFTWTLEYMGAPACATPTYMNACASGDFINSFTFGAYSNLNTGCTGAAPNNLTDYKPQGPTVQAGQTYQVTCGAGTENQYYAVYIDFNNNGSFLDAGEFFNIGQAQANGNVMANVMIPANANAGTYAMRVRSAYNGNNTQLTMADGCQTQLDYGEIEDYNIVIGGGPCPPTLAVNDMNIASGTYQAGTQLTSSGTIGAGNNVTFRAGNNVECQNNFTVPLTSIFEAMIAGCQ